ncbi:uncharacterized protein LOC128680323 [Plodia interpunctella]|uniref:uncharacterized protein LOC128680323 n=1 Tax=Plodia interpunctella TaxID=58824 RepID=UPI00236797DF|nr:uncharacterized protein LOC128680323 [Plodia interpunctella]
MNKYFKNFIMCGDVDYHCLICVETFYTMDDVEKHIRWEKHRKVLKTQSYFPKLRKDSIYKIANQFYCEICNIISPDIADITVHIKGEQHVTNKAKPVEKQNINCKRDSGFIIYSDIILTKEEWNVVVDKRCLICNVPVTGITGLDRHAKTPEHVVKLIQAKVVRENDDKFYRKINPDMIYCLICKKTVSTESLSEHWEDKDHIENKELSISRTSKGSGVIKRKQNENLKKLMEIQKVLYDIDVKGGKATCKNCEKIVKFHFSEMISHQEEHSIEKEDAKKANTTIYSDEEEVKFTEVTDHGKKRAELKQYGKKHNIKLNEGGSRGYCYICHIHVSAHIHVFREHVRGWQHKGHLEYKGIKKETKREPRIYKTAPLKKFLESVFHSAKYQTVWLNSEFCVDNFSFLLVAPIADVPSPKKILCHACTIEYKLEDNEKHLKTAQHKANFIDADVVTTLGGEFIREVAPNLYHCIYCNRQIAYFDNVLRHFRSWSHKDSRINKHMNSVSLKQLKDSPLALFSANPDVLYLQLMEQFAFTRLPKLPAK